MDASAVCYRHPQVGAAVSCQRCERPICTSCMVRAQVGFHCPECTRSQGQTVLSGRRAFGIGGDFVVGKTLIGLNVVMYVLTMLTGGDDTRQLDSVYMRAILFGPWVIQGEWWRLISGAFMHSGLLHIGSNMFLLYLLAQFLEPVVGRVRFAVVYAAAMTGGSLGVMVLSPISPTLGASGAVFGLMAALMVLQLRAHQNPWHSEIGVLFGINVILTFVIPGISIGGHLGGIVAGAAAGALIQPLAWPQRQARVRTAIVAVLAVALGIAAIGAAHYFVPRAIQAAIVGG